MNSENILQYFLLIDNNLGMRIEPNICFPGRSYFSTTLAYLITQESTYITLKFCVLFKSFLMDQAPQIVDTILPKEVFEIAVIFNGPLQFRCSSVSQDLSLAYVIFGVFTH